MGRGLWTLGVFVCLAFGVAASTAFAATRSNLVYAVSAHPDDEIYAWALIQDRPTDYIVFTLLTEGEQTDSCQTADETKAGGGDPGPANGTVGEGFTGGEPGILGPFKYQGPDSPVGEPDKGERRPLGDPWQGQATKACGDARIASWHWFLDDMAELDSGLPSFEVAGDPEKDNDYKGRFCTPSSGCVRVWASNEGARVAFDLGDRGFPFEKNTDPLTAAKVVEAVGALRRNRVAWGLAALPEAGVLTATYYYDGSDSTCGYDDHPDHAAVANAVYDTYLGAGPQYGPSCATEERVAESPGPQATMRPELFYDINAIDPATEQRLGPWVVNYGWLYGTYAFAGRPDPAFWQRFADREPVDPGAADRPPRIILRVRPRRVRTGRTRTFRFTARTGGSPVAGAKIALAGRRASTGRKGRARMVLRFHKPGRKTAKATKRGFRGGRVKVLVR